jgi:Mg-chelatase subunit ChlD
VTSTPWWTCRTPCSATDLAPSRLARARFEIGRLLDRFPSDRIGLIVFTSEAFVQCPLTYDQNALRVFLNTLRPGLASGGGTNTAAALRVALEKHTDSLNTTLRNTSKVIVLVTDGEDYGEDTRQWPATLPTVASACLRSASAARKAAAFPRAVRTSASPRANR